MSEDRDKKRLEMLTRAINTPKVIERLREKYGDTEIDHLGTTDNYMDGMAALARGLSLGLDAAGIRGRKAKRVTMDMLDSLRSSAVVIFMLGFDQANQMIAGGWGLKEEEPWDGGLKESAR